MKKLILLLSVISLMACNPVPKETNVSDAQKLVDAITYVKAKNGICFGVVTTLKQSFNGDATLSYSLVQLDCNLVKL